MQLESIFNYSDITKSVLSCIDDMETLNKCEAVCVLWNKCITEQPDYQAQKEAFFVKKLMPKIALFPLELVDALGGMKKVYQLPIHNLLNQDENFQRGKYIDWLKPEDLGEHKIYRGEDNLGRPFIAYSYKLLDFPSFGNGVKTVHRIYVEDSNNNWTSMGHYGRSFHYRYYEGKQENQEDIKLLKRLFSEEIVTEGSIVSSLGSWSLLPIETNVFSFCKSVFRL